ncbi:MAG: DUF177 domain-containing protein [Lentisphaeria bacterium]|nr:DUF177 domain-containing protein [Lentisphaeria bacterium]
MIRFSVSALEKAPVTLTGTLPPEFLELGPDDLFSPAGEVAYRLTARLVSGGVLLSGTCRTTLRTTCGLCLREFVMPLAAQPRLFFELTGDQEELEVGSDVRAELLLELPMNPRCRPDCRGLCPVCGADRNTQECACVPDAAPGGASPWGALDALNLD